MTWSEGIGFACGALSTNIGSLRVAGNSNGAHADPRVDLSSKLGAQTSFPATQLDGEEHGGSVEANRRREGDGQTDLCEEKPHAET